MPENKFVMHNKIIILKIFSWKTIRNKHNAAPKNPRLFDSFLTIIIFTPFLMNESAR